MRWVSRVSTREDAAEALRELISVLDEVLDAEPDLVLLFVSPHHANDYRYLQTMLRRTWPDASLAGCSCKGVIGRGREVEHGPGLAITAARLDGGWARVDHLGEQQVPDMDAGPEVWRARMGMGAEEDPAAFLVFGDPFHGELETWLAGLDFAFPEVPKLGGLASAAGEPGRNMLFADDQRYASGAVLVALHGALRIDTLVAQGCRPIGPVLTITECAHGSIQQFNRKPAAECMREVAAMLSERDRERMQHALSLGLAEYASPLADGEPEYLIRNLVGVDQRDGSLVVAAEVERGMQVQFHLRDRQAASEELDALLRLHVLEQDGAPATAVLLFSCLGRGEHLFREANHDADLIRAHLDSSCIGGFFCNGEIGPLHQVTYVHGFTSVIGVVRSS